MIVFKMFADKGLTAIRNFQIFFQIFLGIGLNSNSGDG